MQTRDFATLTVPAQHEAIEVSDEQINEFYEANADRFRTPEQVVVEYVELKKESFFDQVEASDEELQELYQKQIANLAEQRRAAHILIETGGELSDDEAKAKIDEIAARVKNGEDFATVAKRSFLIRSANEGGDLGFAGPGLRPSIRRCALCIERRRGLGTGQVGVRLAHHQAARRPVTGGSLRKHEAGAGTRAEGPAGRATLWRPANSWKMLPSRHPTGAACAGAGFDGADHRSVRARGGEGITANRQVIRAAFSEEVLVDGANSSVIELDPDTAVVIRVKEHLKPAAIPLADVRDDIVQQLQRKLAAETARTQGEQLLAELREGKQPKGQWQAVEAATAAGGRRTGAAAGSVPHAASGAAGQAQLLGRGAEQRRLRGCATERRQ